MHERCDGVPITAKEHQRTTETMEWAEEAVKCTRARIWALGKREIG